MHSHHPVVFDHSSNLFNEIVAFAKAKNEIGLKALVKKGVCLGAHQGSLNPVKWLAMQGDTASVDFLVNKFKASRNHAVEGYARGEHFHPVINQLDAGASYYHAVLGFAMGGHEGPVEDYLTDGSDPSVVVLGFAMGGHVEKVDALLQKHPQLIPVALQGFAMASNEQEVEDLLFDQDDWHKVVLGYSMGGYKKQIDSLLDAGADSSMALWGYAEGGHVDSVNAMIKAGLDKDCAVSGYACGGHVNEVNALIADGASLDDALNGYIIGKHLEQEHIFRLMVLTDAVELRLQIANKAEELYSALDVNKLFCDANILNSIMRKYSLDYQQAQGLRVQGVLSWLLEGQQLVAAGSFPNEIFFHIASFVVGLSRCDTEAIYRAVYKHLFSGSGTSLLTRSNQSLFAPTSVRQEQDELAQVTSGSLSPKTF